MNKIKLSPEALTNLNDIRVSYLQLFGLRPNLHKRFELIDRYVMRENDFTRAGLEGKAANRNGDRTKVGNYEMPICFPQLDAAHAFLSGIFLSGNPMFSVVSAEDAYDMAKYGDPQAAEQETDEDTNAALMMSALVERDQNRFNWVPQTSRVLMDVLKYNICAMEVDWCKKTTRSANRRAGNASASKPQQTIIYEGNKLKRINPYNLFFDYTVDPCKVHEEGAFIGYIEAYNYIRVKEFLSSLNSDYAIYSNFNNAISGAGGQYLNQYYVPQLRMDDTSYDPNNWANFFGMQALNRGGNFSGKYEVCTIYAKLIPEEYGIKISQGGTPSPWKLIFISGVLVYAEALDLPHEYLPIILSCGNDDGLFLQTKSFVENLMESQDIASSLMNSTLASLRRAVSDRAIYDPTRIRAADVNSPNPTAKIPVTMNMYNKNLEDAYKSISYNDTASQFFQQNLATVLRLADNMNGMNQASQGSFVKGNRTKEEFVTVQNKADGRSQKYALSLEGNFFSPVKHILKCNYLMYSMSEQVFSPSQGISVSIDPGKFQEEVAEFEVSDGITPADKLANTDVTAAAINAIAQMPEMDMEYSRARMLTGILAAQGLDLRKYRRTPQEVQAYVQQQQQQLLANTGKPQGNSGTGS